MAIVNPMPVRAKICGIRSADDLAIAIAAGADAVGFICGITHYSEDALAPQEALALSRQVPASVGRVLVTHLVQAKEIVDLAALVEVDTIQIHGLVNEPTVRKVVAGAAGRRVIRAIHVVDVGAVEAALRAASYCAAVLLDSRTADRLGGTGRTHDWSVSARIVEALAGTGCRVILAGGLTPANVHDAIATVRPQAVDVNSGVEDADGNKNAAACDAFVSSAHNALSALVEDA
ncbi:phosphoribosylanthranilate isomerase [Nocardia colli]|uniref:phosphoribosylanthranilate isomerase n=1 Tax=Nocardia colli TaxID=2545717 RepID=UPI0035D68FCC